MIRHCVTFKMVPPILVSNLWLRWPPIFTGMTCRRLCLVNLFVSFFWLYGRLSLIFAYFILPNQYLSFLPRPQLVMKPHLLLDTTLNFAETAISLLRPVESNDCLEWK